MTRSSEVMTRSSLTNRSSKQILDLHVQPPTISDHAFIKFVLPSIHMQPIHSIRMLRGWKAFDSQAFSSALHDSLLSIPTETLDLLTLDPALRSLFHGHNQLA